MKPRTCFATIGKPLLNADTPATRLNECRRKARTDVSKKVVPRARSCKQMQADLRAHVRGDLQRDKQAGGMHDAAAARDWRKTHNFESDSRTPDDDV
jgi:hypothetical protein